MYTSIVLFALVNAAPSDVQISPSWEASYAQAWRQSRRENKPLAVFFGRGKPAVNHVSQKPELSAKARTLLAQTDRTYYADTNQAAGRRLARTFDLKGKTGLVISTPGAKNQAFRSSGELSGRQLRRVLARYASGQRSMTRTET